MQEVFIKRLFRVCGEYPSDTTGIKPRTTSTTYR
jgi:hypothetical protein